MKKFNFKICALVLLPGLLFANFAFAELKIVVLDVQRAILASDEAVRFIEQVQKEVAPDAEKVKKIETSAKKLQTQLANSGAIMSEAEKKKLTESIEEKVVNYKYLVGKLQNTQKQKQQELLKLMNPKVEMAIKKLLEENKYDLVLQRQALIFANSELDITSKLTDMLNAQ
ncbi:MAG: OmpH family outer membrane protein [Pseudomonadales bacterium]|nr:OmpH family outer membrane protein [Pseudomonadales bacterium]